MIHLVERAPPPPSQPGSGSGGAAADSGPSSSSMGPSQVPPHDRNANSYVMLGTFNLPVNIMDPQQIQVGFLATHLLTHIPVCADCPLDQPANFCAFCVACMFDIFLKVYVMDVAAKFFPFFPFF